MGSGKVNRYGTVAVIKEAAGGRQVGSKDTLHQTGLAGTGITGQGDNFAFFHVERHPVERLNMLAVENMEMERFSQFDNFQQLAHRAPFLGYSSELTSNCV